MKGGFSLDEGKSADQVRFFSTEVSSADFHERSVSVVEFGSRPAKRARLLSDRDSPVKKAQASSFYTKGLAQGNFLEESDGDVGGMPQRYQADEPMSESSSGVTNELRLRSVGMKVISPVLTSEHMEKRGNTKVLSEQTSGAQDDAKTSLLNHENIDRYAGSTKFLIQQDADDTISTSGDDGLFVIQVRSPTSKQLLHGQKQGIDQEELHSCDGAASSKTNEKQDSYDNPETLVHCHEGGRTVGYCPHESVIVEDDEKSKLDAEEVDSSVEVANIILVGADSKLNVHRDADDRLVNIPAADLGSKNVDGSKYDQQVEELSRSRSDARPRELADADEHQDNEPICYGAISLVCTETCTSLRGEVQTEAPTSLDNGDQLGREYQGAETRGMDAEIIDVGKSEASEEERALTLDAVDNRLNITEENLHQVSRYQAAESRGYDDGPQVQHVASKVTTTEVKITILEADCVGDLGSNLASPNVTGFAIKQDVSADGEASPSLETRINGPDKETATISGEEQMNDLDALGGKFEGASIAGSGSAGYVLTARVKPLVIDGSNHLAPGLSREPIREAEITEAQGLAGDASVFRGVTSSMSMREDLRAASDLAYKEGVATGVELVTESSTKTRSEICNSNLVPSEQDSLQVVKNQTAPFDMNQTSSSDQGDPSSTNNIGGEEKNHQNIDDQVEHSEHQGQDFMLLNLKKLDKVNQKAPALVVADAGHGEEPGVNSSEIPKVYVRTRKQNSSIEIATVDSAALQEYGGSSKPEDAFRLQLKDEDPLDESVIKHYVRRPHCRADFHGPADMTEKSSGLMMTSATDIGNVSACSPQAEHHTDMSAKVETEGILNVFQRRSKKNPTQQDLHRNDSIALQEKATEKHSVEVCYIRADHQPRWLPEGWTLEIRIREGKKTPARIRDKYYYDQKSGHRFRSRNEVLQFLEYERLGKGRMTSDGMGTKFQLEDKKSLPLPIAPAEHAGFQSSLSKSPLTTQTRPDSLAASSPSFPNLHPARMKTTPVRPTSAVSTEANGTDVTWGHVGGPNGPMWLPWGPRGGAIVAGTDGRDQGDKSLKDTVALALDGDAANNSHILKSREGDRLPTGSPVPAVESPGDQGDKENRGKLILRLKRKQPDSDVGKGRSKRPMYEVVHVEKAPSFTSTPTQQEKLTLRERTGQDVPSIPVEEPSSVKDISYERSPITPPMALEQPTSMQLGHGNSTISNHWGIKQNPQQVEVLQQEPYTALGIPATARTSGLQTMASYSVNHTHVFLHPVENTIPLSWQYPFTNQASTRITTSLPTFGPFPSVKYPSVSGTFSIATTVPIPIFEHFPGVSSSMHMNATATLLPCSENRSRDSTSGVKLADGGPQIHKALTAPRALTKVENSKLLLGLGRRLCQLAGLEHKTRDWSKQSRTRATSLEGKSLQQGVSQATSRMQ